MSLPRIKLKTGCSPKIHKKYQEMLDIHLGSISFVATPAWSMLLNFMVRGNGSFTAQRVLLATRTQPWATDCAYRAPTDDITAEEGVDPAHNQRIGDDHGHLSLHGTHHALHGIRVRHWIRRRLTPVLWCLEVCTGLVGCHQRIAARVERSLREHVEIGSHVNAVRKRALLTLSPLVKSLGRVG